MSIELCILGSGSSGNAALLRCPAGVVMIDAGLGPRVLAKRMQNCGTTPADVRAVVLTHLDSDHFSCNNVNALVARDARVFVHASRETDLLRMTADCPQADAFARLVTAFDGPFEPLPGLSFAPVSLAHDRDGSHGFVVDGFGTRVGYATDLGRVPPYLVDAFDGLDVLAIESNYDPQMQLASGRPAFLQHRITGGRGHLSNGQALAAVRAVFDAADRAARPGPAHVVLLHRSRDCNCPTLLRKLFSRDARIAPRLVLADPHVRTAWLSRGTVAPVAGEQLAIAWG